jgi:predicted helicase
LSQFKGHYGLGLKISKDDIFSYVYGVLHDPIYRETYQQNLQREFPKIPFYRDFIQWRTWGQTLLGLHTTYELATAPTIKRRDRADEKVRKTGQSPHVVLRSDREQGIITIDEETELRGIPDAAWDYKLGSRSAIDWVLEQYKERTPRDAMLRDRFNGYHFSDYKEQMIKLLLGVISVSVKTVKIVEAMRATAR